MKMPVIFISDFGPMPAVEDSDYTRALGELGRSLPKPKAIIVMSGHWEAGDVLKVTGSSNPTTIYDYTGFPKSYYDVSYPAPGHPELAADVAKRLTLAGFSTAIDPTRGFDHGAWAPLSRVFPQADIPVIQLTVPSGRDPKEILSIGRVLEPLREESVLIVAAGALIHNLRLIHFGGENDPADAWAMEFDRWLTTTLADNKVEEFTRYAAQSNARLAVPSTEHFDPIFFVLGAANGEPLQTVYHTIRYGNGLLTILKTS